MNRLLVAGIVAILAALLMAVPGSAADPKHLTPPLTGGPPHEPDKTLRWTFAGTTPDWMQSAVRTAMGGHQDRVANNSRSPDFVEKETGLGTVRYWVSLNSPCNSSINPDWIASTCDGRSRSWRIYVRNLDKAPRTISGRRWMWDNAGGCNTGSQTCFDLVRSIAHETLHIQNGSVHNLNEDCSTTVFNPGQRSVIHPCGSHGKYRECDEASSQRLYGVEEPERAYPDCFEELDDAGPHHGLKTGLRILKSSIVACQGQTAFVTGRLEVRGFGSYRAIGFTPLAMRTVSIDLAGGAANVQSTIATDAATGENWRVTLTGTGYGPKTCVAQSDRGDGTGLKTALESSDRVSFTVAWLPWAC